MKIWLSKNITLREKLGKTLYDEMIEGISFAISWTDEKLRKSILCDRSVFECIRTGIEESGFEEKMKNMQRKLNNFNGFPEEIDLIEEEALKFFTSSKRMDHWIKEKNRAANSLFFFLYSGCSR